MLIIVVISVLPEPSNSRLQFRTAGLGTICNSGITMTTSICCHHTHPYGFFVSTGNMKLQGVIRALQHWCPENSRYIEQFTSVYKHMNTSMQTLSNTHSFKLQSIKPWKRIFTTSSRFFPFITALFLP